MDTPAGGHTNGPVTTTTHTHTHHTQTQTRPDTDLHIRGGCKEGVHGRGKGGSARWSEYMEGPKECNQERVHGKAKRGSATWRGCMERPREGVQRRQRSGALRSVPSPLHGTSHSTCAAHVADMARYAAPVSRDSACATFTSDCVQFRLHGTSQSTCAPKLIQCMSHVQRRSKSAGLVPVLRHQPS